MKRVYCLVLLMAGLLAAAAQKPSAGVPRVFLFGHDYVRVEDWARANGGQARWSVPKQEIKVTLPSGNFTFTVDSRRAQMKGTHVWLSLPVAFKNGSAHLGHLDLLGRSLASLRVGLNDTLPADFIDITARLTNSNTFTLDESFLTNLNSSTSFITVY